MDKVTIEVIQVSAPTAEDDTDEEDSDYILGYENLWKKEMR